MTIIRPLTENDSQNYYNLRLNGLSLNPEAFGSGAEAFAKTTVEQSKTMIQSFESSDFILGAFKNEELIGVIGFLREKKYSVSHKATIWGFMVSPEFRNQGVGGLLLQSLIDRASKQDGIEHIRAIVTVSPLNAIRLFNVNGFVQYGLETRGIKHEENFYDQSYLMLKL